MHPLLSDQIWKTLGNNAALTPEVQKLLNVISVTYEQNDTIQEFLHESMELHTLELIRVNEILQAEAVKKSLVINNLKNSFKLLKIDHFDDNLSDEDLLSMSSILAEQVAMRNLAEELLKEQDESMRLIFEGARDFLIYTINQHGFISSWNAGAERIAGFTSEDTIGHHFSVFWGPDEEGTQKANEILQEAISSGKCTYEGWVLVKNGASFWGDTTLTPIYDDAGKLKTLVSITRDITERKAVEKELRKAKEEAEAATRAKSEFLANMSHEIRTPMNGVIGMASLLSETNLDFEQVDYVQTIRSSGESLLAIINDILDFSKIEAGQVDLEELPFMLNACIEEACDLVANRLRNKDVELIYKLSPDTPRYILSDPTRLRQILINLLGNAVKFTSRGEILISTEVAEVREHDILLKISVRDTGIGIPEDKMNRLFRAFSQVDASTTRKFGGTGLGLSICFQLCHIMGGEIWVESEENKGSTFHFTIAIKEAPATLKTPVLQDKDGLIALSAGKRVLIVEDNVTLGSMMQEQLDSAGIISFFVDDFYKANTWLKKHVCNLIIIEHRLVPHSDLHARWISGLGNIVPVLILAPVGERLQTTHASGVIQKPVKHHVFLEKIAALLHDAELPLQNHAQPGQEQSLANIPRLKILLVEDNPLDQKIITRMFDQFGHAVHSVDSQQVMMEVLANPDEPFDFVLLDVDLAKPDYKEVIDLIQAKQTPPPHIFLMNNEVPDQTDPGVSGGDPFFWLEKPVKLPDAARMIFRLMDKLPINKATV